MKTVKLVLALLAVFVAASFLPAPAVLQAQLNRVSVNQIIGTLPATTGGTGQSSYTIGDLLYASSSTALSKLAAVATGQVLTSAGTGTAPAYSANPSVTSMTVKGGTGTGTLKASGIICNSLAANCGTVAYTDAATINQWNVMSVTLPASTLAATGDMIEILFDAKTAANANAKAFQLYFNGGTCSGTGATCCSSGTQVFSDGNSNSGLIQMARDLVFKTGSGTQNISDLSVGSTSIQSANALTASVTDTGTIPIVLCARNTAASAATLQGTPTLLVRYAGQ
jgi:hypothetical protein